MDKPAVPSLLYVPSQSTDEAPQDIFVIAVAYANSGKMLKEHMKNNKEYMYMFPSIVCSGFAIELFLKFFLSIEEKLDSLKERKINRHDVLALWSLLSEKNQILISGMFQNPERTAHTIDKNGYLSRFKEYFESLDRSLFVKWRYAYEIENPEYVSFEIIYDVVDAFGYAANHALNAFNKDHDVDITKNIPRSQVWHTSKKKSR